MEAESEGKNNRILGIYTKLLNGEIVNKTETALNYGVNERSIQRDIDDIREFMDKQVVENGLINHVIYDYKERGYRLESISKKKFSNEEVLAISKILLESRAFDKREMNSLLDKLMECCVPPHNQKLINGLIANERFHYIEPRHVIN